MVTIKEVDLTHIIKSKPVPFGDLLVFRDLPTLRDLEKAEKNGNVIICRLQGTDTERANKVKEIKKELTNNFKSDRLFLDARFSDEDVLSQEEYQSMMKDSFNSDILNCI